MTNPITIKTNTLIVEEEKMHGRGQSTNTTMDIATYRMNWPRAQSNGRLVYAC